MKPWVLLLLVVGCQSSDDITVGAILPLSGPLSYIGEDMKEGIDLAVEEINREGVDGRKIIVVYEDSQGDTKKGVSAYGRLRAKEVSLFITTLSHVTLAIAPLAEEEQTPLFTTAVAPSILDIGEYTFINNFNGEQELDFLVDFLEKYNKIGILAQNVEYGVQYKDVLVREREKRGGEVSVEMFESSTKQYETELLKLKDVDALYIVGFVPHLIAIFTTIEELGIASPVFSYWAAQEERVITDSPSEGLVFPSSPFSEEFAPDFFAKYRAKYGSDPHYRAGLSYDIMKLYEITIDTCGQNTVCIKDELYKINDFIGVTGSTSITAEGGVIKDIVMWQIRNSSFVKI